MVILYSNKENPLDTFWKELGDNEKVKNTRAHFALIGDGMMKNKLIQQKIKRKINNVEFIDSMPKKEIFKYILSSDCGISILQKKKVFETIYSNKTFDYMCCKKPVIMCIDGVSRKLVEDSKAGFFIDPDNHIDFSKKINELISNEKKCQVLGENGYKYVKENFDRNYLSDKYIKKIKDMV